MFNTYTTFLRRISLVLTVGILIHGCSGHSTKVLGAAPAPEPTTTVRQISHGGPNKAVTLRGEMTEKCPVAGCWFMLKDHTGIVRVDTKSSGFVVSEVPLHSTVTVTGTVMAGTQAGIAATGVRY